MNIKVAKPSEIPQDWYGQIVGLDLETEDLPIWSPICLVSIHNPKTDMMLVIPIKAVQAGVTTYIEPAELEILKEFLRTIRVCGHNIQFDLARILYHWGVECDIYLDTFLIARIFQWENQGLKDIALAIKPELRDDILHFTELAGKKPPFSYNVNDMAVVKYSALDSYLPFLIVRTYASQIKSAERIVKLETEYLKTAYRQQARGLIMDMDLFAQRYNDFGVELEQKEKELSDILGRPFKANSSGQKKKLICEEWGLDSPLRTDSGAPSMSQDALERILEGLYDQLRREQEM